jgi:hypothetical protein
MIKSWADAAEAELLDRHSERGTFAYLPDAALSHSR